MMTEKKSNPDSTQTNASAAGGAQAAATAAELDKRMSNSMHDGVEVWCDCCSCEAEPYWVEAMQDKTASSANKN